MSPLLPPAYGAGGAVYLTSNAGFTEVTFQSNSAPSGGAVGVGQSSSGIYFNGCDFNVSRRRLCASGQGLDVWQITSAAILAVQLTSAAPPCAARRATRLMCLAMTCTWRAGWPRLHTSTPTRPPHVRWAACSAAVHSPAACGLCTVRLAHSRSAPCPQRCTPTPPLCRTPRSGGCVVQA